MDRSHPGLPFSVQDLTAIVRAARADTPERIVDHFIHRFLRVPLTEKDRAALAGFLRDRLGTSNVSNVQPGETLEGALRELLYLVLSAPEYQLG